ncbi:hypothetical protein FOXB_03940, partial [Fusarium oxysporum f. sp. conglutinans Fo5176]
PKYYVYILRFLSTLINGYIYLTCYKGLILKGYNFRGPKDFYSVRRTFIQSEGLLF